MTKKELIESIAQSMNCGQAEARQFIDAYQAIMTEQLAHAGEFTLPGIGALKRKTRAARTGRNPRSGELMQIPEKQVIQFKATAPLLRILNPN